MNEALPPEEMVRQVCRSFRTDAFTLIQASQHMVMQFPVASPVSFADGWEALMRNGELTHVPGSPLYYRLLASSHSSSRDE